ncbi:MAG: ATP synthase F1 subunit gamma [Bacilli bacterium]|nr:ATP synthase F1 subunit gamma [Bacilli bacterium]
MSQHITQIKNRKKAVSGVKKITNAMKLVSTIKLQKFRNQMAANKIYSDTLSDILSCVYSSLNEKDRKYFEVNNDVNKNLYIIVSSTLGLCGAYNYNIFEVAEANIKSEDDAIILGKKGISYFKNNEFTKIDGFQDYESINDEKIIQVLSNSVLSAYNKGVYREIHLIYTSYKNSIVFTAKDSCLLPISPKINENGYGPILEPNGKELLKEILPMYVRSYVYSKLLESEVCEHASRTNAMSAASDNANEILNKLQLEFNKARQAAITEQITEIVGAANSL